jgi:hypothetical protein
MKMNFDSTSKTPHLKDQDRQPIQTSHKKFIKNSFNFQNPDVAWIQSHVRMHLYPLNSIIMNQT